jgi:hypothetical protein
MGRRVEAEGWKKNAFAELNHPPVRSDGADRGSNAFLGRTSLDVEPRVRVRSSCRFMRSSCISFCDWLTSLRRRLRYHVMLALWAARNSEAMVALSCAVNREGSILRSLLVCEFASSTRSKVGVLERRRLAGKRVAYSVRFVPSP